MTAKIEIIDTPEKLHAIEPEWRELAADQPFLGWDWAQLWWQNYGNASNRLFVLAVRDHLDTLIGLAPWYCGQGLTCGRVLRFIGSNEVCGDRLTILTTPERRAEVVEAIADCLSNDLRESFDLIELTGVEHADETVNALCDAMSARGNLTHFREDLSCWKIALPDSWDGYLASISRSRRMKTRKLLKRSFEVGRAAQRMVTSPYDFEHGFGLLVELHQKRRNSIGEPGCFVSEQYCAFHHEFARRMLNQGRLRLAWTEIGNRPAAIEYNLLGNDTVFHYQGGFEPALSDEQPGWLNLVASLRWAIESGHRSFDMLRGDEPYKASFGAKPCPLMQVRIVGQTRSAKIRHAAWKTQANMKRWARQGLKLANDWRKPQAKATSQSADEPAEAHA